MFKKRYMKNTLISNVEMQKVETQLKCDNYENCINNRLLDKQ